MVKSKTYAQKCAVYASVIKANPGISANEIGRRYHNTPLGMRKEDRNGFVGTFAKQHAEAENFKASIKNSDMSKTTQDRLNSVAKRMSYKNAKFSTKQGDKINKDGGKYPPVSVLGRKTFNRVPKHGPDDFVEFYG